MNNIAPILTAGRVLLPSGLYQSCLECGRAWADQMDLDAPLPDRFTLTAEDFDSLRREHPILYPRLIDQPGVLIEMEDVATRGFIKRLRKRRKARKAARE
jgi:hypothetical protein